MFFSGYWLIILDVFSALFFLFQCIWDMGASFSADLKRLLLIIYVLGREMGSPLKFELKFVLSLEDCISSGFGFFLSFDSDDLLQTWPINKLSDKHFHTLEKFYACLRKLPLICLVQCVTNRSKMAQLYHWCSSFPWNLVANIGLIESVTAYVWNTIDVSLYWPFHALWNHTSVLRVVHIEKLWMTL